MSDTEQDVELRLTSSGATGKHRRGGLADIVADAPPVGPMTAALATFRLCGDWADWTLADRLLPHARAELQSELARIQRALYAIDQLEAHVAQQVEQRAVNALVAGSNPAGGAR